ncbi:hypothetical protein ACQP1U_09930 [Actinomycetota bacterium]
MADDTESTPDPVSDVRGHLIEAMRLIDQLERSMRPIAGPADHEAGDE